MGLENSLLCTDYSVMRSPHRFYKYSALNHIIGLLTELDIAVFKTAIFDHDIKILRSSTLSNTIPASASAAQFLCAATALLRILDTQ